MTTTGELSFRFPDGWSAQPVDPESGSGVDFVAIFQKSDQGFTPNITCASQIWIDDSGVDGIADISARQLQHSYPDVVVEHRSSLGSERAPGIGQRLRFTAPVAGVPVELSQTQIILSLTPPDQPGGMIVVKAAFTATVRQVPSLITDFQAFVGSIRLGK